MGGRGFVHPPVRELHGRVGEMSRWGVRRMLSHGPSLDRGGAGGRPTAAGRAQPIQGASTSSPSVRNPLLSRPSAESTMPTMPSALARGLRTARMLSTRPTTASSTPKKGSQPDTNARPDTMIAVIARPPTPGEAGAWPATPAEYPGYPGYEAAGYPCAV